MLLAAVAGLLVGWALAVPEPPFIISSLLEVAANLSAIILATAHALAIPLVFAAIVTGLDGLEPMRGAGRLAGKIALWIAGSNAVAVAIGVGVALCWPRTRALRHLAGTPEGASAWPGWSGGPWWIGLVFLAAGLGVYRNQIEESRARLLVRLAMAVGEAGALIVEWIQPWLPAIVFVVSVSMAAAQTPNLRMVAAHAPVFFGALATGWAIYGLVFLPAVLWFSARIHAGRLFLAMAAPLLAAVAGASPRPSCPSHLEPPAGRAEFRTGWPA